MSVTIDQVLWTYRLILEREPEDLEAVGRHLVAADVGTLRRGFLASGEYRAREPVVQAATEEPGAARAAASQPADAQEVGRFLDVSRINVQVDCDEAERDAMLQRIAAEWQKFGAEDPHWSVLVDDAFRSENIKNNIEVFYNSGQSVVELVRSILGRAGLADRSFKKVLDFGCGVGRLTLALAARADEIVGVDISPLHLKAATERAQEVGIANAVFEPIDRVNDLDRYAGFDLVVSLIVLQHNPPPVMAALFGKLLAALAPGGIAVIQLPTYIEGYSFSVADYLSRQQPAMEMNMLPQRAVFEIAERAGCRMLEVREDRMIGAMGVSQTFVMQRR